MKTRRALSLVLVMAMILSMFTMVLPASAAPAERRIASHTRSRTNYTYYTDEQLMEMLQITDPTKLTQLRLSAHEAIMNGESWNVTSFGLKNEGQVFTALRELIWGDPELFFIYSIGGYANSSNVITTVTYTHLDSYEVSMAQHAALELAAQEIMCLFQRTELTELELAILVHDYLVANYEYHLPTLDLPQNQGKYSAYNLLVEGTAVCQGYAEAYAYLMMQFGINCGLCKSDTLNHAWSILELDGKEYHVDVTWDDPVNDVDGYVEHVDFLVSTDKLKKTHNADDFSGNPANAEYDTAFWQDVTSAFCLVNDTIYYINSSGWLCSWTDETTSTALYKIEGSWPAGDGYVYSGNFSRLATDGKRLFFTSPTTVYEYVPADNSVKELHTPSLTGDNALYGLAIKGNTLRVNYYTTPIFDDNTKAENTIVYPYPDGTEGIHEYGEAVVVTPPTCQTEGEARYDCIYCGFSKTEVLPAEPDNHTYSEEGTQTKAPTCQAEGEISYKCLYCDAVKTEAVPVVDHNWLDATCTTPITCSYCGAEQEGESGYILINSVDELKDNDQIVIVANVDGSYKALDTTISGKIDPVTVTVDGNKVIADALPVWTIKASSDGYALNNGSDFLAYNSSTNFTSSSTEYAWGMEPASNGGFVMNSTATTRGIYYQHSGGKFGAYSTSNQNNAGYVSELFIFKFSVSGGALGHTEDTVPGKAATCTEDGLTDGIVCSVCGETIQEQEVIPSTGHTEVEVAGKAATCTEDGLTAGSKCSVCGETTKEQETIPATGHTEKQVAGSEPTCTQPGMSAGIICATCGISLSDQEITPALGHDETYTPNNDGTHTITCSRCDLSEKSECTYADGVCDYCDYEEPVSEGGFELATSIAVGDKVVLVSEGASMELSGISTTSTKYGIGTAYIDAVQELYVLEVVEGNQDGTFAFMHDGMYLYWTSGNSLNVNATLNSKTSWTVTFDAEGNATIKNASTPARVIWWNVTNPRFACYTDKSANTQYYNVQFYKYVPANTGECQHEGKTITYTQPADCISDGYNDWYCADCGNKWQEIISAKGHTPGTEPFENILLDPTCYYEGKKETYNLCIDCNAYCNQQDVAIPMIPHSYEEGYCTMCSKDAPGKQFYLTTLEKLPEATTAVIYHPASGMAISLNASGEKLTGSAVTVENGVLTTAEDTAVFQFQYFPWEDPAIFRVMDHSNRFLTSGETGNNLFYGDYQDYESSELTYWIPSLVNAEDSTFQITNKAAAYNGTTNQALEFYKELFTVYGIQSNDQFYFQFYTDVKPACVHSWDEGQVTTEPKCNAEGTMVYACTLCGETKTEVLPAVDHAWTAGTPVEPTCTEDGYTPYTCPDCEAEKSEPIPATGHSMDDGIITTAPTCIEDGIKTFTCSVCDYEKTEVVPATGHSMVDGTCTVCGYTKPTVAAGQYVIAANVNGTYYAMSNTFGKKIDGTVVTVTDGKITKSDAEGFLVTLSNVDGGWTIQAPDGNYLKYASSTDLGEDTASYVWTIAEGTNGTWRVSAQKEGRGLIFRASTYNQFGGYATSNIKPAGTDYYDVELIPVMAPDVELISRSISLNGNIAVNFYMSLCDEVSFDPNAYMLFKQEGKEDRLVYIRDSVEKQVRGTNAYIFSCEVSAKEMTDTITAQFFYGDGLSTEEYIYSVKAYADNQRENLADNEALMDLLDAMLRYGAASQLQFNYHTERLADADLEKADYTDVVIDGYPITKPQGTELVNLVGASLILKSETTLRYFFRVDPSVAESFTVTYNGAPLAVTYRSGLYSVDVTDIAAPELDMEFTVTVNDGVQEADVTYSPLTYCQSVRSKDTSTDILKDVCAALYLYNRAANRFFEPAE